MLITRILLTLSLHSSLLAVSLIKSYRLHPVSTQSWCMYVFSGWQSLVAPYVVVYARTLLMRWSFLLQNCRSCFVCLNWIACEIDGNWLYSSCFVGCWFQDLLKTSYNILVLFSCGSFSKCFAIVRLCNHRVAPRRLLFGRILVSFYQIVQISRSSKICQL